MNSTNLEIWYQMLLLIVCNHLDFLNRILIEQIWWLITPKQENMLNILNLNKNYEPQKLVTCSEEKMKKCVNYQKDDSSAYIYFMDKKVLYEICKIFKIQFEKKGIIQE
eukprot:TRINITY_DN25575_c0_g1_i1.p3 TRINITY_DN25575_c0_g1~~TRINITY_DN25575_c0_g1_i1.p3  ORF type:complete len:109 (-),score=6.73 TRINITY_DN25575_c0_g1_i1:92-418(-)